MAEFKDLRGGELAHSRASKFKSFIPEEFGVPSAQAEEYRFTPLERMQTLLNSDYGQERNGFSVAGEELALGGVLALDARLQPAAEGAVKVTLRERLASEPALVGAPTDVFAALAGKHAPVVLEVQIAPEAEVEKPIRVRIDSKELSARAQQIKIVSGAHSRAHVVLEYVGSHLLTEAVEVLGGDHAELNVVSLHLYDRASVHATNYRMRVGRDGQFKHAVVSLGGSLVRVIPEVDYAGPGGDVELLGLYLTDSGQHHEHRLFVHHNQPKCKSNVNYRGALHGKDNHAVWIGDVLIDTPADGTDSYEQNRNLVLNLGPQVDSVPNLEIANGNIEGAGHASATMRFDEEQLFYLQARGISLEEARRMIVNGFFAELIGQIGLEEVQEEIMALVQAELDGGEF